MLFAGIRRKHCFSPNNIGNDQAIFDLATAHIRSMGHQVNVYDEEEFLSRKLIEENIFTMTRELNAVRILQGMETRGAKIINSAFGIENCYRGNMTKLFDSCDILVPPSIIVNTNNPNPNDFEKLGPCWIKRGDFHTIHKEDVTYAKNAEIGCSVLGEYARRGIASAVLSKHIQGDLVKFYGVTGTDFFYYFYPEEHQHSKFGYEKINGKSEHFPFQLDKLQAIAAKAAKTLQIEIYGGDVIISADNNIYLIDMNDWPSFAPCREQAAGHISQRIHKFAEN